MIIRTYFAETLVNFWRLEKNINILKKKIQLSHHQLIDHQLIDLTSAVHKNGQNNVSFGQFSNIFES